MWALRVSEGEMREALQATDLVSMISDDPSITLLAPTDRAFADHFEEAGMSATEFMADDLTLRDILLYHIITEGLSLNDILFGEISGEATFATALGPDVEFVSSVAGGGAAEMPDEVVVGASVVGLGATEDEAEVAGNTIAFTDGYLIPIDGLLVPPAQ